MKNKAIQQKDGSWRFVFYPKNNDEHEICVRFQLAADRATHPNRCLACMGGGIASKGHYCVPCRGTGIIEPEGKAPLRADGGPKLPEGSGTTPKTRKKSSKKALIASNPRKTGSGVTKKRG